MSRNSTFPTLFNEVLQLNVTKLKNWGYLEPQKVQSGIVTWSRNGNESGRINIKVDTTCESPFIELEYSYRDEPRKYIVNLISKQSNLGVGKLWFFECPSTNKLCRKLYLVNGYFLHREAFQGCFYESQAQSKYFRFLEMKLGSYIKLEQFYEELYKKNFKKTYAGKPTKRYLKLMSEIQKGESISYEEFERLVSLGK